MKAKASLNNIRISPRKIKLMVDLIRHKEIKNALSILSCIKKKSSISLKKLLMSLLSNWNRKYNNVDSNNLYIQEIRVNQGKTLKRIQPVPQGRGHRIKKRSSSVIVVLDKK